MKQAAVDEFENDIVLQAQRLESEGKTGLVILPGVMDLLTEVSSVFLFCCCLRHTCSTRRGDTTTRNPDVKELMISYNVPQKINQYGQ